MQEPRNSLHCITPPPIPLFFLSNDARMLSPHDLNYENHGSWSSNQLENLNFITQTRGPAGNGPFRRGQDDPPPKQKVSFPSAVTLFTEEAAPHAMRSARRLWPWWHSRAGWRVLRLSGLSDLRVCVLTWECLARYGIVADWSAVSALTREVNACWKLVLTAEWGGERLWLLRQSAVGGQGTRFKGHDVWWLGTADCRQGFVEFRR